MLKVISWLVFDPTLRPVSYLDDRGIEFLLAWMLLALST